MITTFGINSKKYSDLPLTYAPATGFKWRLISAYIASSDTGMTVQFHLNRNSLGVFTALTTSGTAYLAGFQASKSIYAEMDFGSLDGLQVTQSGGVTGDTVTAVITVEVLPA